MSNRFDQKPGMDYARCKDCGVTVSTRREADEHMNATLEQSETRHSHTMFIQNPTRPERIRSRVSDLVGDTINDALEELCSLVRGGQISHEEATTAISEWPDFRTAWDEGDF
ncbi:hypothetical protein [Pseudoclavibacter sp. CFCC 11306]|uniref:hypothetical protein n=1 Tax=Pseudoclavibacter sp. CFCC 11306 TaxID=1564493 RepID=UPI001300ED94|nr:hypothetical protein [Pseudoclavibacter sp. CFCC 11306]KAB1658986.1 hypothetical protein F8O09_05315 [Pseudoclavibacter sp. CFCC 11306]